MMPGSSDFIIETGIPIPPKTEPAFKEQEEPEEPELHLEDTRWVPFKQHKRKCKPDDHYPMIGRCEKCGDIFPCPSGKCGHLDCKDPRLAGFDCDGNGTDLPEFLQVIYDGFLQESLMARATGGTITITQEDQET